MGFGVIYNEDVDTDEVMLLTYINEFTKAMGIMRVVVDPNIIRSILFGIRQNFPHNEGLEYASAFKKIAHFVVTFISERPIRRPFDIEVIGRELANIPNHQNAIVGMQLAIDNLHHAVIHLKDGSTLSLKNRITLSEHSYIDIIDALQAPTHMTHFKMTTVLLEQMAYKSNPDCQYNLMDI